MAFHARSISFPSRTHQVTLSVEDQLHRLRTSEATSPSLLCEKLDGLKNLYECLDGMLQLPLTQQALSRESDSKYMGDVLDGSLGLLDLCGTIKDVFSQMKDCVQDLESSHRRKICGESSLSKYLISKKNINKTVTKCCANLKKMQKSNSVLLDKYSNPSAAVETLREVEAVSLTMFESLLSFVCPPKTRSKSIGQSLASKFIQSKHVFPEFIDGLQSIDAALCGLNKLKSQKGDETKQLQNVQKALQALESTIQEVEEGLEGVFRQLIKIRVTLLNILNH